MELHFLSFGIHCMRSAYESAYTPIVLSDGRIGLGVVNDCQLSTLAIV